MPKKHYDGQAHFFECSTPDSFSSFTGCNSAQSEMLSSLFCLMDVILLHVLACLHLIVLSGFVIVSKFAPTSLNDNTSEMDAVKAMPLKGMQPAHFDTVVGMQGEDAEATSLQGDYIDDLPSTFIF